MKNENLIPYNEELLNEKATEFVDACREMGAVLFVSFTHKDDPATHSIVEASPRDIVGFMVSFFSDLDEIEADHIINEITYFSKRIRKSKENE